MKQTLFIIALGIILSSCCEPSGIEGIQICDQFIDSNRFQARCTSQDSISSTSSFISISTQVVNVNAEEIIVFRIFDSLTGETIIEYSDTLENTGESRVNSERCIWDLVHSFELPEGSEWPKGRMEATIEINKLPPILRGYFSF